MRMRNSQGMGPELVDTAILSKMAAPMHTTRLASKKQRETKVGYTCLCSRWKATRFVFVRVSVGTECLLGIERERESFI